MALLRAQLLASRGQPAPEVEPLLTRVLTDDTWRDAPGELWDALYTFADTARRDVLLGRLVRALRKGPLDSAARNIIARLLASTRGTPESIEGCLDLLLDARQPNDAGRVADALEPERRPGCPEISTALRLRASEWLLELGSGELRSASRARLTVELARFFVDHDRRDSAEIAFRLALANDRRLGDGGILEPRTIVDLVEVFERGGQRRAPWLELTLEKSTPRLAAEVLGEILHANRSHDRLRSELVRLLSTGRLAEDLAVRAWSQILQTATPPPAQSGAITHRGTLKAGLGTLSALATGHDPLGSRASLPEHDAVKRWTALLLRSLLQRRAAGGARAGLGVAVGRNRMVAAGATEALREAWSGEGPLAKHPLADEALALLEWAPEPSTVLAVLDLSDVPYDQPADGGHVLPNELVPRLESLLRFPWVEPVAGFDLGRALRGLRRVRFETLSDSAAVAIRTDELLIEPERLDGILGLGLPLRERTALVELFVVHELVHVAQAISDKKVVEGIRRSGRGGEMTLLHFDLSADHIAAAALERAQYADQLLWLKDLQGQSLAAFPAGPPLRQDSCRLLMISESGRRGDEHGGVQRGLPREDGPEDDGAARCERDVARGGGRSGAADALAVAA